MVELLIHGADVRLCVHILLVFGLLRIQREIFHNVFHIFTDFRTNFRKMSELQGNLNQVRVVFFTVQLNLLVLLNIGAIQDLFQWDLAGSIFILLLLLRLLIDAARKFIGCTFYVFGRVDCGQRVEKINASGIEGRGVVRLALNVSPLDALLVGRERFHFSGA